MMITYSSIVCPRSSSRRALQAPIALRIIHPLL
jgi:hypothetical protein